MSDVFTPAAQRALDRAEARTRARGGSEVEPNDLLAALADEAESRAAELMARFGLAPTHLLELLGLDSPGSDDVSNMASEAAKSERAEEWPGSIPYSSELRMVLASATARARALDRSLAVGTEHLLAGLIDDGNADIERLVAAGFQLENLRIHFAETLEAASEPIVPLEEIPPLDLSDSTRVVDVARILDASANRAREGLRVVEDYVRFVLDDPGLTRRLKEARHRLANALRGFDTDLLIGSRDTREDVGTHI